MKWIALVAIILLFAKNTCAQGVLSKADSLYRNGEIMAAIEEHQKTYVRDSSDYFNLYNLACIYAEIRMPDSAFKYLYIAARLNSVELPLCDPDFIPLYKDKRWGVFENQLISLIQSKYDNPISDIAYAKKLWLMHAFDQAHYRDINTAEQKINRYSPIVYVLWGIKEQYNEQNQKDLEVLIAKKGWPKISQVGNSAASAAFLIIQHADLAKQKKYLPIIKKLCEEKEASWGSYALMYDRVQVRENKAQRYGSQVSFDNKTKQYTLDPLEDENKVDEWRKEIGMKPLADYLKNWDINWVPKTK